MRRAKGILLIVAGGTGVGAPAFGLSYVTTFALNAQDVSLSIDPRGWLFLAADVALALWLLQAGQSICSRPARPDERSCRYPQPPPDGGEYRRGGAGDEEFRPVRTASHCPQNTNGPMTGPQMLASGAGRHHRGYAAA